MTILRTTIAAALMLAALLVTSPAPRPAPHAAAHTTPATDMSLAAGITNTTNQLAAAGALAARAQLDQWLAGQAAAASQREAELEAARAAPRSSAPVSGPVGACGGATNGADRYIARESGGNPGIWNASGSSAYGCYQILGSTWASSCSDLGPEVGSSPSTQAACASRLPLSAWGG